MSQLRYAGAAAAAATAAAAGVAYAAFTREFGDEALPRLARTYRTAIPAFAAYKGVQFLHETLPARLGRPVDAAAAAAAYEQLHGIWAPRALEMVLELRGFNLKSSQMVASNFGNVFPKAWQRTFEPLLDAVPAKPFATVRATVERELGRPLGDVFATFDEAPLAAASIGQVHRATLRDGGKRVVVKVMYPEVEGQFRGDVLAARRFLEVAVPEHLPAINEIEKQFASEFDYRREAAQLALVRANLARSPFSHIVVPAPHPTLCTKAVLTMDEVPRCTKLTSALEEDMAFFAARRGITVAALVAEEDAATAAALARGELRCGPSAADMGAWASQLRWRNWARALVGLPPEHVPLNHAALVDELLAVHGYEVLIDGAFNGDPHPGNVLVSRPRGPAGPVHLALIDYGQVKQLDAPRRLLLARLIAALARADGARPAHRARVAALARATGYATARNDDDVAFESMRLFFDRDDLITTRGQNTQAYIEALAARDAVVSIGDDFVLAARASLMLRGLASMLNQPRSAAKAWQPFADRVMREAGEDPEAVLAA